MKRFCAGGVVLALVLCFLAPGCTSVPDASGEEFLEQGAAILQRAAVPHIPRGIYMPEAAWDEDVLVRLNSERIPDWVLDDSAVCIYWERAYTRREMNQRRQRGEPVQWTLRGTASGWVVMGDDTLHILEVVIEDQGERVVAISAWEAPPPLPSGT